MAKYKAYPEYKHSGVEWIDSIPSHWEVKPTFALCDASTKKNFDGAENNVLSLSYGNIIPRDVETNFGLLPESFNTYQIVDNRDLILRLTDLQNDKNSLRVGLAKQKGIITSAYLKLKAKDGMNPTFLYRLLHSYDTTKVFYGMGGGLRQSMKFEDFRRLPLLVPPKEEQLNISAFLDHETAKIDSLIEKQQQLIELLKEKRQAVISHAVTKGLNPNVPMKESGVEWLGEVPEHWRLKQIRHLCTFLGGGTPSKSNPDFWAGNIPWVSPKDMKFDYIFDAEDHISESAVKQSSTKIIPVNSVLIVVRGMILSHSVPVAINTNRVTINQDMKALIPNFEISPEYLHLVLKGFKKSLLDLTDNSAHGTKCLKTESFERMQIPLPPLHEQNKIIFDMKELISKIDSLLNRQYEATALLQERRTALISAAVTGKIDVRDWVAPNSSEMANIEESPEVNA
ncbi:restriction endonuclease subunit S [Pectobacterium parmentieri]|uniref:restriction endonuclease subunit S n=1 Tax=Pectobacterium parmentieri TaxID=1905730 RepID=UPI001373CF11|nr:restriction endonuclease subunit S [Pectobacterium parmentieri]QHQ17297.1 restriction endonuclease subunit S [Pectobacterium parmentieri]